MARTHLLHLLDEVREGKRVVGQGQQRHAGARHAKDIPLLVRLGIGLG